MKKGFCVLGIIIGLSVAFCGILVFAGVFGGNTNGYEYTNPKPFTYESGRAAFGGDFYTYVNNNAAEAAAAGKCIANDLAKTARLLKNVCGLFLLGFGLMSACAFIIALKETSAPIVFPSPSQVPHAAQTDAAGESGVSSL